MRSPTQVPEGTTITALVHDYLRKDESLAPAEIARRLKSDRNIDANLPAVRYGRETYFTKQGRAIPLLRNPKPKIQAEAKTSAESPFTRPLSEETEVVRTYLESHLDDCARLSPTLLRDKITADTGEEVRYRTVANERARLLYQRNRSRVTNAAVQQPRNGEHKINRIANALKGMDAAVPSKRPATSTPIPSIVHHPASNSVPGTDIFSLDAIKALKEAVAAVGGMEAAQRIMDLF